MEDERIKIAEYDSPCGKLLLGSFGERLCLCDWAETGKGMDLSSRLKRALNAEAEAGSSEVIEKACAQLEEYFRGERRAFDVPLLFVGTAFQKSVWNSLLEIPYAATASYAQIARSLGRPSSVRAVANAIGANPLSIFAPCHRVIGSNGTLTGYRGGLSAKRMLLELEGANS